jgi:hypothetical protein
VKLSFPRPLWLFLLTAAVIVAGGAFRIGFHVRERRALVRHIEEHGGMIVWRLIGPESLRSEVNEDFDEICGVHFKPDEETFFRRHSGFTGPLPWTKGASVDDASIRCLRNAPYLKELSLQGTNISDAGMVHVGHLHNLEYLDIGSTDVSDASVPLLCRLPRLQELSLEGSKVSEAGIAELERAIPALKVTR